ncbi:MAG: DUF2336 domain-containing protein [Pseudolabrys sp.]|jgi:uncharacterized protein (DUF2336 family)|nr:DUF2336 domain-containing protein [Pseudolabrys sp.]
MSTAKQSLILELDAALSKASNFRQLQILRSITDLFVLGADSYSEEQVAIFDDVITRLIENMDQRSLGELSARLADVANPPKGVVAQLSGSDNIAISGPALEKSEGLSDEALVSIATSKSQKHLKAIAARRSLSEVVTDVLVERGDPEVSRRVSANLGARLSEMGFVKLINRAKKDRSLADTIAGRDDLPPELVPFLKLAQES